MIVIRREGAAGLTPWGSLITGRRGWGHLTLYHTGVAGSMTEAAAASVLPPGEEDRDGTVSKSNMTIHKKRQGQRPFLHPQDIRDRQRKGDRERCTLTPVQWQGGRRYKMTPPLGDTPPPS